MNPSRPRSFGPPPKLRVRGPADFLAVVPYLLGFHPSESLVSVLSRRGRVVLTARLDLPPLPLVGPVLDQLRRLSHEHGIDELVLLAYTEDEPQGHRLLEQVLAGVDPRPRVREALLVSHGRWWSLTGGGSCWPADGTPFDPTAHPLAAEAVYAGLSAGRGRSVLQAQVQGPGTADVPRLRAAVQRARSVVERLDRSAAAARMAATVRAALEDGSGPDEETCALLAVLALDLRVRDVAWALMSRVAVADHLRVWSAVVARSPVEVAAAPLGLLGMAGWVSGNGALLNCCVERLERTDPAYTLGHLLAELSEQAVPPALWEELVEGLRAEVGAVIDGSGLH